MDAIPHFSAPVTWLWYLRCKDLKNQFFWIGFIAWRTFACPLLIYSISRMFSLLFKSPHYCRQLLCVLFLFEWACQVSVSKMSCWLVNILSCAMIILITRPVFKGEFFFFDLLKVRQFYWNLSKFRQKQIFMQSSGPLAGYTIKDCRSKHGSWSNIHSSVLYLYMLTNESTKSKVCT